MMPGPSMMWRTTIAVGAFALGFVLVCTAFAVGGRAEHGIVAAGGFLLAVALAGSGKAIRKLRARRLTETARPPRP